MIGIHSCARRLATVWVVSIAGFGIVAATGHDQERPDPTTVARVLVTSKDPATEASKVSVEIRRSADSAPIATATCAFGRHCALEVAGTDSVLLVAATAPGYWPEEQVLTVPEDLRVEALLTLTRTGVVRGRLKVPRGQKIPEKLVLKFAQTQEAADRDDRSSGEVVAMVEDEGFEVAIPEGLHDLKLRAKGFVSSFFWSVDVAAEKALSLRTIALQPGSSVVGRVEKLERTADLDDVTIELEPVTDPLRADRTHQTTFASTEVLPKSRGVFTFDGVRPGSYRVRAWDSGGAAASFSPVVVYEGSESEIAQPLTLQPPATVEVWVSPMTGPDGLPWTIDLARMHAMPGRLVAVASGTTDEAGITRFESIPFGDYKVSVVSAGGERWFYEDRGVSHQDEVVSISLEEVWVVGTVSIGDEPLLAELWFGGSSGAVRSHFESNGEGEFEGGLPRGGEWLVEIKSRDADVDRQFMVTVESTPLEIVLPANELIGWVVDGEANAVEGAQVTGAPIDRIEFPLITSTDAEGRFRFAALEAGSIRLTARHDGRSSEVVEHAVIPGEPGDDGPVLVLRDRETIEGRVVGTAGGVFGCIVTLWPTGSDISLSGRDTTDHEGRFELQVPVGQTGGERQLDFILLPPGHVLRSGSIRLVAGDELVFNVPGRGGELVLDIGALSARETLPMVVHNGVMINLPTLFKWLHIVGKPIDPADQVFRLPAVEGGEWLLCGIKTDRLATAFGGDPNQLPCDRGILSLGGSLYLKMPR